MPPRDWTQGLIVGATCTALSIGAALYFTQPEPYAECRTDSECEGVDSAPATDCAPKIGPAINREPASRFGRWV